MKKTINSIAKEIGSGITPLRSEKSFWDSNDIPWLKTEQLGEYKIFDTSEYISKAALQNTSIKLWPIHTVSIAMYGEGKTRGNASILMSEMATNQACCNIIVDEQQADYRFLYYWIKHNYIQLRTLAAGVRKNLNSDDIKRFPFPDFSQKQQQAIANVLSSFDERITLNQSICSELEAMAKTLYDYWFVQFDFPDENGKPYRTSGGAMEWCQELGREVPKGWKTTTIGDITICHDSERIPLSDNQRQEIFGEIPYYGATGMMGSVNRAIFDGDYVLMAEDGSVMDQQGHPILQRIHHPCWINNHAHVLEPKAEYSCMLLYMLLKDIPVVKIKTGSIQMKINQANMNAYHIIDIPAQLRLKANGFLSHIDNQIDEIKNENQELSKLRDWLLPMLMNGQAFIH